MKFQETPLKGAFLIDLETFDDERGFFARAFCSEEFQSHGLEPVVQQANTSFSHSKGTLRGLHYQIPPKAETKLVRCISGAIWDVILDVRETSPTFGKSYGVTLSQGNRKMVYVPKGFAHGFITLEHNTEVIYFVSEKYSPTHEKGIRWNDPLFSIPWKDQPLVISKRDQSHPDFKREGVGT